MSGQRGAVRANGRAGLVACALLLSWPLPGSAFQRSRDDKTGACLWWKGRTLRFFTNVACSEDVSLRACLEAVEASAVQWNGHACSDLTLVSAGTTPRTDVGFDQEHWDDNLNLVVWQEDRWNHDRRAIALATTTYDTESGRIVDADIELNGVYFSFSTSDTPLVRTDIQNTLTHELGHLLGLDHSALLDATMYANADEGELEKRDLHPDDIAGLCYIYPIGEKTPSCLPENSRRAGCGCAAADGHQPASEIFFLWLWGILGLGLRRGARRSRQAHRERVVPS